jgi:RHS repeat-associated protein
VQWGWTYNPFGVPALYYNPNNITQNLAMPGQYYDPETTLSTNGFRQYANILGRYISSDPIGLAGGTNTYQYVKGNPFKYTDPRGLDPGDTPITCDTPDNPACSGGNPPITLGGPCGPNGNPGDPGDPGNNPSPAVSPTPPISPWISGAGEVAAWASGFCAAFQISCPATGSVAIVALVYRAVASPGQTAATAWGDYAIGDLSQGIPVYGPIAGQFGQSIWDNWIDGNYPSPQPPAPNPETGPGSCSQQ